MNNRKKMLIIIIMFVSGAALYAKSMDKLYDKTFDVKPGETLKVEADMGDVKVEAWDNNEVHILVYGNKKAAQKIEFTFEKVSDGVFVKADKEGGFWSNIFSSGNNLRFEIKVPSDFNLDISTAGGDVSDAGIKGEHKVRTSGGDVEIRDTEGPLHAGTSGGDIEVRTHNGPMVLKTSGGDIKAANTNGNLEAKTSGGDIRLQAENGKVSASTSGGDIDLDFTGNNEGIELRTSGGDIGIRVPSDMKAELELKSSGGDVDFDFDSAKVFKIKSGSVEAQLNGGGPRFTAKTSGGDINFSGR